MSKLIEKPFILLIISGVLTLFLSLISRFVYAFIAFIFDANPIEFPTVVVIVVSVLIIITTFIVKKFRRYWRMVLCFVMPFLISSIIVCSMFYNIKVGSFSNGYCRIGYGGGFSSCGVMNKFGIQIIPEKYSHIDFSSPIEIIGYRGHKRHNDDGYYHYWDDKKNYNYIDHFDLRGNFLYTEENY